MTRVHVQSTNENICFILYRKTKDLVDIGFEIKILNIDLKADPKSLTRILSIT